MGPLGPSYFAIPHCHLGEGPKPIVGTDAQASQDSRGENWDVLRDAKQTHKPKAQYSKILKIESAEHYNGGVGFRAYG